MYAICYRRAEPVVYNRGTKYETRCEVFLDRELHGFTKEQGLKKVRELNANKPPEIKYYFLNKQKPMEP